jgi:hypothetical protein
MPSSSSTRAANLASSIKSSLSSRAMPTPYSPYRRLNRECRIDLDSGRCSACIAVGRSGGRFACDLVITAKDCKRSSKLSDLWASVAVSARTCRASTSPAGSRRIRSARSLSSFCNPSNPPWSSWANSAVSFRE